MRTTSATKPASLIATVLVSIFSFASCSNNSNNFCNQSISVAGISTLLSHGLGNVSETQYADLEHDLKIAYELSKSAIRNSKDNSDATHFAVKLQKFIALMDKLSWDFSTALLDVNASNAAADLGTQESLSQANAVESFVITTCGMPSTIAIDSSADTLPSPSIPSPNATEPPTGNQNQVSEYIATGKVLAKTYGVTISDSGAQCLGAALSGVVDSTSAAADPSAYTKQFQKAFDLCGISVPATVES